MNTRVWILLIAAAGIAVAQVINEAKKRMKVSGDQKALSHLLRCIVHKEAHEHARTVTPMAAAF